MAGCKASWFAFRVCNNHHRITIVGQSQVWKILSNCFADFMKNCFDFVSLPTALFFARWPSSSFEFSSTPTFIERGYLTWCTFSISIIIHCNIVVFISILVSPCEVFSRQNLQLVHADVHKGV